MFARKCCQAQRNNTIFANLFLFFQNGYLLKNTQIQNYNTITKNE